MLTFIFCLFSLNYLAIAVIRQMMNCLQTLYVDIWLSVAQLLYVVRWKDKCDVFALSTFHGNACNNELPYEPEINET